MDNCIAESSQAFPSLQVSDDGVSLTYTFVNTDSSVCQIGQSDGLNSQDMVQQAEHTNMLYPQFQQATDANLSMTTSQLHSHSGNDDDEAGFDPGIIQFTSVDGSLDQGQTYPQQVFLQLDPTIHEAGETEVFSSVVATLSQHLLGSIPGIKEALLQELCKMEKLVLLSDIDNNFFSVSGSLDSVMKFGEKLKCFIGPDKKDDSDKENRNKFEGKSNVDVGVNCDLLKPQVTSRGRFIRKPLKFDSSYYSYNQSASEEEELEEERTHSKRKGQYRLFGRKAGRPAKVTRKSVYLQNGQMHVNEKDQNVGGSVTRSLQGDQVENISTTILDSIAKSQNSESSHHDTNTASNTDITNTEETHNSEIDDLTNSSEAQKKSKLYEQKMPFKYFCKLCSFKSKRESHMVKHKAIHEQNPDLPILQCDNCDFKCIRSSVLQLHQISHSDSQQLYRCKMCKFVTNRAKQLQAHINIKHSSDSKKPSKPMLHCYMSGCMFQTKFQAKLHKHLKLHGIPTTGEEEKTSTFQCELCPYRTTQKGHLGRHMNNIHTDRRPFLCDLCGMTFKRQDTLSAHKNTHLEKSERTLPVKCDHCHKGFKSEAHMKEHMSVHSSARTYLCHICGAAFKTKAVQKKHIESIHVHPRAYSCMVCEKAFNTKHALQRHCRTHVSLVSDTTPPQEVSQVSQVTMDDINTIQTISIPAEQLSQLALQAVSGSQEGFGQDVISVPSIGESLDQGEDIRQYNIQTNEATTALLYLTNMQTSVDVDNI